MNADAASRDDMDDGDEYGQSPSQQQQRRRTGGAGDEEEEHEVDPAVARAAERAERRERRRKVRHYYGTTKFGLPSSVVVFDLCSTMSQIQNDQIWAACVGVTDHFINQKMNEDT